MPKKNFSYSEMSLFNWDRNKYYKQYVLGEPFEPNEKMRVGKIIHSYLENNKYPLVKELKELGITGKRMVKIKQALDKIEPKLLPEKEVVMCAELKGIKLMGIFDGFDRKQRNLDEYKTTDNTGRKWYQSDIDRNDQLSFYALMYKLSHFQYFREIRLYRINTEKGTVKTYYTARGYRDLKYIEEKILKAVFELQSLGWYDKRFSRKDRELLDQKKLEI